MMTVRLIAHTPDPERVVAEVLLTHHAELYANLSNTSCYALFFVQLRIAKVKHKYVIRLAAHRLYPFGVRGVGDQTNGHHKSHSSVILVSGAKFAMVFLMPTFSKRISTIWSPAAGLTATTVPRPKTLCSTTSPGS